MMRLVLAGESSSSHDPDASLLGFLTDSTVLTKTPKVTQDLKARHPAWKAAVRVAASAVVPALLLASAGQSTQAGAGFGHRRQEQRGLSTFGAYEDAFVYVRWSALAEYLQSLVERKVLSAEAKGKTWTLLSSLALKLNGKIPPPVVHTGEGEHLLMTWWSEDGYLEIEAIPGEEIGVYYRDQRTGEDEEIYFAEGSDAPGELVAALRKFQS